MKTTSSEMVNRSSKACIKANERSGCAARRTVSRVLLSSFLRSRVQQCDVVYPESHAIVLDRWLLDVCGEDDMRFPSHRRAQFAEYMQHLQSMQTQKAFVHNTFLYPGRSGTRETLVLQQTLAALDGYTQHLQAVVETMKQSAARNRGSNVSTPSHRQCVQASASRAGQDEYEDTGALNDAQDTTSHAAGADTPTITTEETDLSLCANMRSSASHLAEDATAYLRDELPSSGDVTRDTLMDANHTKSAHCSLTMEELCALQTTCDEVSLCKERLTSEYAQLCRDCAHVQRMTEETQLAMQSGQKIADTRCKNTQSGDVEQPIWHHRSERADPYTIHDTSTANIDTEDAELDAAHELDELCALRRSLCDLLLAARRALARSDQAHVSRFTVARYRLTEWQKKSEQLRHGCAVLEGQVRVIRAGIMMQAGQLMSSKTASCHTDSHSNHDTRARSASITFTHTTTMTATSGSVNNGSGSSSSSSSSTGNIGRRCRDGVFLMQHLRRVHALFTERMSEQLCRVGLHRGKSHAVLHGRGGCHMSSLHQANYSDDTVNGHPSNLSTRSGSSSSRSSTRTCRDGDGVRSGTWFVSYNTTPNTTSLISPASCSVPPLPSCAAVESSTPTGGGSRTVQSHRSRYSLVVHLAQWQKMLEEEREAMWHAARVTSAPLHDPSVGGVVPSFVDLVNDEEEVQSARESYMALRQLLID